MIPVVIESPYAAPTDEGVAANLTYLDRCILDCLRRGETPYASHKMLTTALNDRAPAERALGIQAGLAMRKILAPRFYIDLGWSSGMLAAKAIYDADGILYTIRRLDP